MLLSYFRILVTHKYDSITPILATFKCLHKLAPIYLSELLVLYTPSCSLRCEGKNLLLEQFVNTVQFGESTLKYCAPTLWNSLPQYMRDCDSLESFKSSLKTILFKEAYSL